MLLSIVLFAATAGAQRKDKPGAKDPELFTRIPGYVLTEVQELQFDAYQFVTGEKTADKQRVEGRVAKYHYRWDPEVGAKPSTLQVIRNYQNAAARLGGKKIFEDQLGRRTTLLVSKNGRETWVEVYAISTLCTVVILEKQAMKQDVVANAAAFQAGLAEHGRVEVPGIFFDFAKSEVKPESEPALQEIARLLASNPSLRVWVVGHTDNVGPAEANLKLSAERAAAVIRVLTTKMSVDPKRLSPFGNGPYAPVASNAAEDGRAKNRRVELVAQP
jgi:outer membrane protein OmpA-like peptidoglycan-associated protein